MKRDFTHENFEDFLKRSADSLRMKAPDKVWNNLSKELNKRRRRFTIGLGAFLLVSSAVGYAIISGGPQSDLAIGESHQQTTEELAKQKPGADRTATPSFTPGETTRQTAPLVQLPTKRLPADREKNVTGAIIVPFHQPSASAGNMTANSADIQPLAQNDFTPTIVDSYTEFDTQELLNRKETIQKAIPDPASPLTIESVLNSYKAKNRKQRFETQFYFTPTISYRKLSENKSYLRGLDMASIPPNFPALHSSVNKNVTHKPDVGFELGFTTKYAVSSKLKIRAGVQFNVNRYDVKAFSSPMSVATIALNNGASIDSFNTISSYSNERGYKSNWLQNLSFQVSAPVGVEYLFGGNDMVQFGIGTTVQPTYILGDRAYQITTDYKKYTQEPWLIRRWNVNTAFETFVMLNSGKTRWQIGPQVRYQLLSSFISEYPVKENLFDFGLKVGVSLNK